MNRRDAIKSGVTLLAGLALPRMTGAEGARHARKVIGAGAGYDSLWRGLEAATRSAHRAVKAIDAA